MTKNKSNKVLYDIDMIKDFLKYKFATDAVEYRLATFTIL